MNQTVTTLTDPTPVAAPIAESERIYSLDVLRGVALLGMLIVHFYDYSAPGVGGAAAVQWAIGTFASEKFFALFALLFGVGFGIQLQRAEHRGTAFGRVYLRRLAGLFLFGFAAHALLGFSVLLGYSVVGAVLLLIYRWSTRALFAVALTFTLGWAAYNAVLGGYEWLSLGWEEADRVHQARMASGGERWAALSAARAQESYWVLLQARLRHMAWFYSQPFMLIPNELPLFLFGLLALRHRLFHDPRGHARLIAAVMGVGVAAWALHTWVLPQIGSFGPQRVVDAVRYSSRLGQWLMFAYAGGIVLLLAYRPAARRYLAPFGWSGRMALSNYFIQIIALDLLISEYAFGLAPFDAAFILPSAVLFFAAQVLISRWWLSRYRFGPAEWLWRSLTYGRFQPMRVARGAATALQAT